MELKYLTIVTALCLISFGWIWWYSHNQLKKKEKLIRKLFDRCHNLEAENVELKNLVKDSN
jgi:hypothetical protein